MTLLLIILLSAFIETDALNYFTVEPESDDTILALNKMINATFRCTCIAGDACTIPPFWSLENGGRYFATNDDDDAIILAERGITYSSSGTLALISIPATVKNNNTRIFCAGLIFGGTEFSDPPIKLIIIGPPLPPEPVLAFNKSSKLIIQWKTPYSHQKYPVGSYNIQIMNKSSGDVLESLLGYVETSYVHTFEDGMQYCQIITVNVTAISDVGQSIPASVTAGFPIAPQLFQSDVTVVVIFPNNGTPMANISFTAPFICDYQTASYMLTIQATTGDELQPVIRQSVYTGWNRSIVEVITTGLQINYNYTLTITVVEEDFEVEVSSAVNFTTFIPHNGAADVGSSSLGATLLGLVILILCIVHLQLSA